MNATIILSSIKENVSAKLGPTIAAVFLLLTLFILICGINMFTSWLAEKFRERFEKR